MKSTGIVRQIDNMGRISIPKEIRSYFDLKNGEDSLDIYLDEDRIILKKHGVSCVFCGSDKGCIDYVGKYVCAECVGRLNLMKENLRDMGELE